MGMIMQNGRIFATGEEYHKYSTEEHIVGEWIDGSPVYEKTFVFSTEIQFRSNAYFGTTKHLPIGSKMKECTLSRPTGILFGYFFNVDDTTGEIKTYFPYDGVISEGSTLTVRYTKSST